MAVMGKKVWAIVCGAIRNKFELYTTLATLCDYRKQDLIEGIVISTWKGELENIVGLRERLLELDIFVVESDSLDVDAGKFIDMNFLRQTYQLRKGLEILPDDVFVLRCRTDYSQERISDCRDVLEGKIDMSIGNFGSMNFGFKYRIGVCRYTCNIFFAFTDSGFLGYKNDLLKMTNMQMVVYMNDRKPVADYHFFMNLIKWQFPIFDEILSLIFLGLDYGTRLKTLCSKIDNSEFELPGIMNKWHALQFIIMHNCFCLMTQQYNQNVPDFYLSDVFSCKTELGLYNDFWGVCIKNPEVIRRIVCGECIATKGYMKLYRQINMFMQKGYAETVTITLNDYNETWTWLKDVLMIEPQKWLNPYKKIVLEQKDYSDMGLKETMNCLIGDNKLEVGDEESYIMNYLVHGKNGWFYSRLSNELENIVSINEIYDSALSAAGRSLIPWVLKKIAIEAYNSEDYEYGKELGFVFERWATAQNMLYTFPMIAEKLSALYYYGKFQEKNGVCVIPKMLYIKLCQRFKVPINPDIKQYIPEIYEVIKGIIKRDYSQYYSNIDVKNLINFWIDEFGLVELPQEAVEMLSGVSIYRKYVKLFQVNDPQAYNKLLVKAGSLNSCVEVKNIYKLILSEMYYQDENIKDKVMNLINDWIVSGLLSEDVYVVSLAKTGDFSREKFRTEMELRKGCSAQEYTLVCQLLLQSGHIGEVLEILEKYADTPEKRTAFNLIIKMQKHKNVCLFTVKNNNEFWLNYKYNDPEILEFEKNNFKTNKGPDGALWPHTTEVASRSPFAMFIRPSVAGILVSVEFCAISSIMKHYLFEELSKEYNLIIDNEINRLYIKDIKIDDVMTYENVLETALIEFEKIAIRIQECYEKIKEIIER